MVVPIAPAPVVIASRAPLVAFIIPVSVVFAAVAPVMKYIAPAPAVFVAAGSVLARVANTRCGGHLYSGGAVRCVDLCHGALRPSATRVHMQETPAQYIMWRFAGNDDKRAPCSSVLSSPSMSLPAPRRSLEHWLRIHRGPDHAAKMELAVTSYCGGWKMKMQLCATHLFNAVLLVQAVHDQVDQSTVAVPPPTVLSGTRGGVEKAREEAEVKCWSDVADKESLLLGELCRSGTMSGLLGASSLASRGRRALARGLGQGQEEEGERRGRGGGGWTSRLRCLVSSEQFGLDSLGDDSWCSRILPGFDSGYSLCVSLGVFSFFTLPSSYGDSDPEIYSPALEDDFRNSYRILGCSHCSHGNLAITVRAPWCLTVTCSVLVSPEEHTKSVFSARWLQWIHAHASVYCWYGGGHISLNMSENTCGVDVDATVLMVATGFSLHRVNSGVKEATFPWTCLRTCEVSPSTPLFLWWQLALQHCANSVLDCAVQLVYLG